MSDFAQKNRQAPEKTVIRQNKKKPSSVGLLGKRGLLVVVSKNALGKAFVVDKQSLVLGRKEDCDIIIEDELLSREHCRISVDEKGNFFIEDLKSTNSTWLNSVELKTKSELRYGDRILLGNTIFRFFLEEDLEKK
jgi:pSer/pThr/pTyr-binding forkhead associated (FHA) protein